MKIKGVKIGLKHVVYLALVVLSLLLWNQCNKTDEMKVRAERAEANIKALNDSLREERDKNGDLVYRKRELQTNLKELKKYNSSLHEKVTSLKKKVEQATEVEYVIKHDTTTVPSKVDSSYDMDGKYGLRWKHSEEFAGANSRYIEGVSEFRIDTSGFIIPDSTKITRDEIRVELFTGVNRTEDGDREIFVRSKYPNFKVEKLNGANLGPPEKSDKRGDRFVVGPSFGAGVDATGKVRPFIGFNVTYNLNRQYKIVREKLTSN